MIAAGEVLRLVEADAVAPHLEPRQAVVEVGVELTQGPFVTGRQLPRLVRRVLGGGQDATGRGRLGGGACRGGEGEQDEGRWCGERDDQPGGASWGCHGLR